METFIVLLSFYAGSSAVTGEFPANRPVTQSLDVFFDLDQKQQLSKQWRAGDLRRHRTHHDVVVMWNS